MSRLLEDFTKNVSTTPDKLALVMDGAAFSYRRLSKEAARWHALLESQGVKNGDAIGMILPNVPEFVLLLLAAAARGAMVVPLCPSLPAEAIHRAFSAAGVRHVFGTAAVSKRLEAEPGPELLPITVGPSSGDCLCTDEILGNLPEECGPLPTAVADSAPYLLLTTSGSTGTPKPILLSQECKWLRAQAAAALYQVGADDITLAATPLYHSLAERLVLLPLITGGTAVVMKTFSAEGWIQQVQKQKVSFTIAVSSQLRQIAGQLAVADQRVASLRCVVSSSAVLEEQTKADLLSRLRCQFHECYGTSEVAIATNLGGNDTEGKIQSVGCAAPGVSLCIAGENGSSAPVGEVGEILVKTPMMFQGYYRQPELTADAMRDGYFKTGDLGSLDEDGFLYFRGRKKDVIITGGINIYPADVEDVILRHPSVRECVAFALPDERLGEVVGVVLVPEDSFELRKLRHDCADALADFQLPRRYFLTDQIPRNKLGKITRHSLSAMYARDEEPK